MELLWKESKGMHADPYGNDDEYLSNQVETHDPASDTFFHQLTCTV